MLAVPNRTDHLEAGLSQYSRQAVGDNRVIVSEQYGVPMSRATALPVGSRASKAAIAPARIPTTTIG